MFFTYGRLPFLIVGKVTFALLLLERLYIQNVAYLCLMIFFLHLNEFSWSENHDTYLFVRKWIEARV